MDHFELHSEFAPTGDQPQAIEQLVQGFKEGNQCQTLLGVTGSGKTFTMANVIKELNKPTLIIAHNKTLAAQLYGEFKELRTNEALGKEVGESRETIRRYIRLTELIPEILEMVDDKKISMRPAVELSYLPKEEQEILYDTMESEACTPSHAQAIKIRKFSAEGRLNEDVLLSIMSEEKPNQVEQWKIPKNRLEKYFPSGTTQQKMEETIIKALELYRKREKSRER